MTKFNIKAGILKNIFSYVQAIGRTVKGENKPMLKDLILNVSKSNIKVEAIDENEVLITLIKAPMKKDLVKEIGNIPFDLDETNKKNHVNGIKRFKNDETITVRYVQDEGTDIVIFKRVKPKLEVELPTIALDTVTSSVSADIPFKFSKKTNTWSAGELVLDTYIKIDAEEFMEVVQDGEQIEYRSFPITVYEKYVLVTVSDDESGAKIRRQLNAKEIKTKETIGSIYSYGFGNAFGNLKGEIEIWLCNEGPMIIRKTTEEINLVYILATTELEEDSQEDGEGSVDGVDDEDINNQLAESMDDNNEDDENE